MTSSESQQPILDGMPSGERFDPNRRRAFGSVPGLIGRNMDIPSFGRLDQLGLTMAEPAAIQSGLLGREGGYAVDGIVLSPEEYTTVVRSPRSFQTAIQGRTVAASRQANPIRKEEKRLRSGEQSLIGKQEKHRTYIDYLETERADLQTLMEWQRMPGYSRTSQENMVALAGKTWNNTFLGMLTVLKDQYELKPEQYTNLTDAVAYRLFKGPQNDKMAYWGGMLDVAKRYNLAKSSLFKNRHNRIARKAGKLTADLKDFSDINGIQ